MVLTGKVIEQEDEQPQFTVGEDILSAVAEVPGRLVVLCAAGRARGGKSTHLVITANMLYNGTFAQPPFEARAALRSVTNGADICLIKSEELKPEIREKLQSKYGSEDGPVHVLLLDCEGLEMNDPGLLTKLTMTCFVLSSACSFHVNATMTMADFDTVATALARARELAETAGRAGGSRSVLELLNSTQLFFLLKNTSAEVLAEGGESPDDVLQSVGARVLAGLSNPRSCVCIPPPPVDQEGRVNVADERSQFQQAYVGLLHTQLGLADGAAPAKLIPCPLFASLLRVLIQQLKVTPINIRDALTQYRLQEEVPRLVQSQLVRLVDGLSEEVPSGSFSLSTALGALERGARQATQQLLRTFGERDFVGSEFDQRARSSVQTLVASLSTTTQQDYLREKAEYNSQRERTTNKGLDMKEEEYDDQEFRPTTRNIPLGQVYSCCKAPAGSPGCGLRPGFFGDPERSEGAKAALALGTFGTALFVDALFNRQQFHGGSLQDKSIEVDAFDVASVRKKRMVPAGVNVKYTMPEWSDGRFDPRFRQILSKAKSDLVAA